MGRKLTRKGLVKKLDAIVSKITRKRDTSCVVCGSRSNLQCGHIFSRVNYSTRWDIGPDGNCQTQCAGCNLKHEYDAYPFLRWYTKIFGEKKLEELHIKSQKTSKLSDKDLLRILGRLEEIEENMGQSLDQEIEKYF